MRVVLLQEERYIPCYHGSSKSNRSLLESLARSGHDCTALCTVLPRDGELRTFLPSMRERGIEIRLSSPDLLSFACRGIQVQGMPRFADSKAREAFLVDRMNELRPDIVLVSSSPGSYQLRSALQAAPDRTIYLAHGHHDLPFGPNAEAPNPARTQLLRRAAAIVTVSRYGVNYFREYGRMEAQRLRFPVYGEGPFPNLGSFDRGAVTLLRSAVSKGVAIFMALAACFPQRPFTASTWGATAETLAALRRLPNVALFDPEEDIGTILAGAKVLLVPSVLPETFGLVVPEAMVRGIPVLASDLGGLPEAMLGVGKPIAVNTATFVNGCYECPAQDLSEWRDALERLLTDRAFYERRSRESRAASAHFIAPISARPFEDLFSAVRGRPRGERERVVAVVDPFDAGWLLAGELKRRGCRVVGVVSNEDLDADITAKYEPAAVSTLVHHRNDIGRTLSLLRAHAVQAVLAGCETGVMLADELGERMHLVSNGTQKSEGRRNKFLMAEAARQAGLGVPDQQYSTDLDELREWVRQRGVWPVVVKPPQSLASDGVFLCRSEDELAVGFARTVGGRNIAGIRNDGLLVQAVMDATQYVVDTISLDGNHYLSGIWCYGRPSFASALLAALAGGTAWPDAVRHLDWRSLAYGAIGSVSKEIVPGEGEVAETLFGYACRMLDALEIRHGPAHFELMLTAEGVRLVEVGARVHGAPQTHVVNRMCTGISQVEQTADLFLDPERFLLNARRSYSLRWRAIMVRLKVWRMGVFQGLRGFERIARLESFHDAFAIASSGARIPGCVGVVILLHPDEAAIARDCRTIRHLEEEDLFDLAPAPKEDD